MLNSARPELNPQPRAKRVTWVAGASQEMSCSTKVGIWMLAAGLGLAIGAPVDSAKTTPAAAATPGTAASATPVVATEAAPTPAATTEKAPTPGIVETKTEILDTTSDEHVSRTMTAAADSSAEKTAQLDSAQAASAAVKDPTVLETLKLAKFKVGGLLRTVVSGRDLSAENDASKTATMGIDLARLSFAGQYETGYSFGAELDFAKSGGGLGIGQIYMQYQKGAFNQVRAGRIKRMFSHEAILSDNQLPFNFRGSLYQDFLNKTTGYAGYDVGVNFASGWEDAGIPVHYQLGIYNGRRADTSARAYTVDAWKDADLKAKDLAFHIDAQVLPTLLLEAGLSTKTTENKSDASNFDLAINTAYQFGAFYTHHDLKVNGEVAYGDNHKGRDALITEGSSNFLAFYVEAVVHRKYATKQWSELLVKYEGLDPDMGFGNDDGKPNDGKFRYSIGGTYGLNADNSLTLVYGVLHPITESQVTSDSRLRHDVDLFWKMSF